MKHRSPITAFLIVLAVSACDGSDTNSGNMPTANSATNLPEITAVTSSGEPGNYNFSVTVGSPDTGCNSYADWWEVVSADGSLLYRRILNHSHVDEQPFTRSGGPVNITATENVICLLYTSPSPRDATLSRMPSSA